MRVQIVKREEHEVAKRYRVELLYNENGEIIGAVVYIPRTMKSVYIARNERVAIRIPQAVRNFLRKHGFRV